MASASPAADEFDLYLNVQSIFTMKARGSDTIKDIKIRFCNQGGVSEDLQDIFFDGACLEDHRTLTDYGVRKNSTLDLMMNTTLARKLFIKVPAKKYSTTVIVKASDTIEYLKLIIQTEVGTRSDGFSLMHNGKLLEDNKTLASLYIASDSTLYAISKPRDVLSISVRTPDNVIATLEVRVLSSVSDLTVLVGSMTGMPIEDKILVYEGQVLEMSRTLFSYGIKDESVLELKSFIISKPRDVLSISVRTPDNVIAILEVRVLSSVSDLMVLVGSMTGMPIEDKILVHEGQVLETSRTLFSYGIKDESVLELKSFIQIFVKPWDGNTITLEVHPSDTTEQLNEKIFDKLQRIPRCYHPLIFEGKQLDPNRTLESYNVRKNSTVVMGCPKTQ
ncbi:Polyubiquitin-like protein [Drosera capensis]